MELIKYDALDTGCWISPYSCRIYPTCKAHLLCAPQCCHLWPML